MDYPSFVFAIFYIAQLVNNVKGFACDVEVERVGCFNDKSRPLDKLLVYSRTSLPLAKLLVYRRIPYNHEEQKIALPRLLCDCAVNAQLQGYHYIGLQYYTECWTSSESEPHYSRDGPSTDKCFNAEFQPCSQDDTDCVGGARANFIYKIVNPDKATSEMNGTSSTSSAQEVLQLQATTEMKLPTTLPLTPTFQVTQPSKQPSSTPPLSTFYVTESITYTPSTQEYIPSESTFQIPNKPSEQTEQPIQITISSVQTAVIEPTTPSSEPTLQMTEKPTIPSSLNNETQPPEMTEIIPSTVAPVASTTKPPCYDTSVESPECISLSSFCTDDVVLLLCPRTCHQCRD
ncbi:Hypothetical predicted protein [Paramuricea clavata]|uniref:Uncharacterized protein n=1 Tax=Paramuricea clavata TaxID=317549 RepID=A0A6S7FK43_PARCT|nr:Hypothetical predicted protein [Paramuricea clavata]